MKRANEESIEHARSVEIIFLPLKPFLIYVFLFTLFLYFLIFLFTFFPYFCQPNYARLCHLMIRSLCKNMALKKIASRSLCENMTLKEIMSWSLCKIMTLGKIASLEARLTRTAITRRREESRGRGRMEDVARRSRMDADTRGRMRGSNEALRRVFRSTSRESGCLERPRVRVMVANPGRLRVLLRPRRGWRVIQRRQLLRGFRRGSRDFGSRCSHLDRHSTERGIGNRVLSRPSLCTQFLFFVERI